MICVGDLLWWLGRSLGVGFALEIRWRLVGILIVLFGAIEVADLRLGCNGSII